MVPPARSAVFRRIHLTAVLTIMSVAAWRRADTQRFHYRVEAREGQMGARVERGILGSVAPVAAAQSVPLHMREAVRAVPR